MRESISLSLFLHALSSQAFELFQGQVRPPLKVIFASFNRNARFLDVLIMIFFLFYHIIFVCGYFIEQQQVLFSPSPTMTLPLQYDNTLYTRL